MITPDDVSQAYELTEPGPFLARAVQAANAYVSRLPDIDTVTTTTVTDAGETVETTEWSDATKLGAMMLAARLYERRDSRGGVISIGESASYVARYDSDIARLLRIDAFTKPKAC